MPLGANNASVVLLLDHWAKHLTDTARVESMLSDSIGVLMVRDKRKDLESKGQLDPDKLAKLAQTIAKGGCVDHKLFWIALARRIVGEGEADPITEDLTSVGKAAFEAVFPDGSGGPEFPEFCVWKENLLSEIKTPFSTKTKLQQKRQRKRLNGGKSSSSGSEAESPKKKARKEPEKKEANVKPQAKADSSSSSGSDSSGEEKPKKTKEQKKRDKEEAEKERLRLIAEKVARRRVENKGKMQEEEKRNAETQARRAQAEEEKSSKDQEEGAKRKAQRERKKQREALKKARIEEATKKKVAAVAGSGPIDLD